MIKVKTESGEVINGVVKDDLGNLIVVNNNEYNKYLLEKQRVDQINNLTKQVEDLNNLVKSLLSKNQQGN